MLFIDFSHGFAQAAPNQLQPDVAHAHEWSNATGEEHLHAARRAHPDRTGDQRLRQLRRRNDQRKHACPTHCREPRLIGNGQARGATEPLEVHGCRKADAGPGHQEAEIERFAQRALRGRGR